MIVVMLIIILYIMQIGNTMCIDIKPCESKHLPTRISIV